MVFPPAIYEVPRVQCILLCNALSRNSGITFKVCSRRLYRTSCYFNILSLFGFQYFLFLFLFMIFKLLRWLGGMVGPNFHSNYYKYCTNYLFRIRYVPLQILGTLGKKISEFKYILYEMVCLYSVKFNISKVYFL